MLKRQIVFVLLLNILIAFVLIPAGVFYGPFPHLRQVVVGSIATSRHPFVAEWFLSPEKINEILGGATVMKLDEAQNTKGFDFLKNKSEAVTVEEITGKRYTGKVMLISDPLRLKVATSSRLGDTGETVKEMVNRVGAVGGVNGGSFIDPNGSGNGGFADGITMHNGKFVSEVDGHVGIIGIDKKGVLIVGTYSKQEMIDLGIQEAVTFSPALVINGKGTITSGDGGWGIAPRTAIGQRADGTIILIVINGRQMSSVGATLKEVQDLMLQYGAITAANLDGGASATMVYQGEVINNPSSLFGERRIPTAWVVMPNRSANFE